jgi:hypothetical protein
MKTELYLHIPKPCHENWDAMTAADKGKFCASCSKEVIDFSLLTDAEVLNYFKRSTGNTCGRFHTDQLQRPLQETIIEKRQGWKWLVAGISSLIMVSRGNAQKKENSPLLIGKTVCKDPKLELVEKVKPRQTKSVTAKIKTAASISKNYDMGIVGDVVVIAAGRKITISGYVVDDHNEPVSAAEIFVNNNILAGVTNAKGYFEITTNTQEATLPISFRSFGFDDESSVIDLLEDEVKLRVSMKPKIIQLPEVSVVSYIPQRCIAIAGGVVAYQNPPKKDTVRSKMDVAVSFIRNIINLNHSFNIYPNPAPKNSIVHISIKEEGSYQVQLFDNNSRLLHAEESTEAKQQAIAFQLPAGIASGTYYVRLVKMQTKKYYTGKIIVQ